MKSKKQELKIRFVTRPEYTHKIFDILEELLEIIILDKSRRYEFIIGLGEALDNAIIHGNKRDPDKFVEVDCIIDESKISCVINDEGTGFDHKKHLAVPMSEFDPKALVHKASKGKINGLGLGLIRKCIDEVHFNERGNQITLVKYISPSLVTKK